jgi:two-component system response regulator HydG
MSEDWACFHRYNAATADLMQRRTPQAVRPTEDPAGGGVPLRGIYRRDTGQHVSHLTPLIGQSPAIANLVALLRRVARSRATVLIQGESGTGKELVAREIHRHSPRLRQPFVTIDCGAVLEALLESELFGHVKGAFTGAVAQRQGLFQAAHGGTLLLDEIGNTSLAFQAKLLRALQEGEIRPVGSNRSIKVDVRIIASTNVDLRGAVEAKTFRQDLYYRLAVIPILIPPLRQRREDIPLLVDHFIDMICRRDQLPRKQISKAALQQLIDYPWPGNVRELEHVIERAVLLSLGDEIQPEDMVVTQPTDDHLMTLSQAVDEATARVERQTILETLCRVGHNRTRAARFLGISRATLYTKLKRYGLTSSQNKKLGSASANLDTARLQVRGWN